MGSVTKYAALFVKIKALQNKLLSESDYHALIHLESADEVINYLLTKTVYGKSIATSDQPRDKAVVVERSLRQYLFDRYEQMLHFLVDEDKRAFKTLFIRYEIESLKIVIRSVYSRVRDTASVNSLVTSKHFWVDDFSTLLASESLDSLVAALAGTPYMNVLKPYLNESRDRILFYLEMALDRFYFKKLNDRIDDLKGEGHLYMRESLGLNIDFLNIEWIYRGRKFYHLAPEELFNYSLKGGLNLSLRDIKALCYVEDEANFLKMLKATAYGYLFDQSDDVNLIIEREMEREVYRVMNERVKGAHYNLIAPISYLHKLEFEIRDIFAILEAKSYRLNAEETKRFLVRQLSIEN